MTTHKKNQKKGNNRTNQVLLPKIISTPGRDRGKERITKSERKENRGSSTEKIWKKQEVQQVYVTRKKETKNSYNSTNQMHLPKFIYVIIRDRRDK